MAISITRYVDITSGVGGGAGVRKRELIARIFSTNPLIPTKSFIEFNSADEVLTYFGSTSEEYKRAAFYFGWISKNITKAPKIAFARWTDVDVAPRIYGKVQPQSIANYTAISNGGFTLTMGVYTFDILSLNFTTDTTLAQVASRIETAIRAQTGGGGLWTGASVSYDSVRGSFNLVGGATGTAPISVAAATVGSDISSLIGWLTGSIKSDGALAETITNTLSASAEASTNFGSFGFIPEFNLTQVTEAATWNDNQNVKFMYSVGVSAANAASWSAALIGFSGITLTLRQTNEYHSMIPMIILAATRYDRRNSVQNYMFQIFTATPTVTTNADANLYDPLRINYYGRTQTAGQFLDFYQRGVMMGIPTDPVDQNIYANEMWLKDDAQARIMSLFLSLAKVSANTTGRSQLMTTIQGAVDAALFNGTISVGKTLDTTQKLYITQITGDDTAWQQVQNIGYWFDVVFNTTVTVDGRTEYKATYVLVYSKDDTIRKVEASHVLI